MMPAGKRETPVTLVILKAIVWVWAVGGLTSCAVVGQGVDLLVDPGGGAGKCGFGLDMWSLTTASEFAGGEMGCGWRFDYRLVPKDGEYASSVCFGLLLDWPDGEGDLRPSLQFDAALGLHIDEGEAAVGPVLTGRMRLPLFESDICCAVNLEVGYVWAPISNASFPHSDLSGVSVGLGMVAYIE